MAKARNQPEPSSDKQFNGTVHRARVSNRELIKVLDKVPHKMRDNGFLLEVVVLLTRLGKFLTDYSGELEYRNQALFSHLGENYLALADAFTMALSRHEIGDNLTTVFKKTKLSIIEIKILLIFSCMSFGLGTRKRDVEDLMQALYGNQYRQVDIIRALLPTGRLAKSGLGKLKFSESYERYSIARVYRGSSES